MSRELLAAGDVLELKLFTYCRDQVGINILHYLVVQDDPASTRDSLLLISQALDAVYTAAMKGAMSAEASWEGVSLRFLGPGPASVELRSTISLGVGTTAGDVLPTQVTGIITKRTRSPGRAFRGRMYVPFPSEASSDTKGVPNAAYVTKLQTIATQMLLTVGDGDPTLPVQVRLIVGKNTVGASGRLVTVCSVNRKFATQRRRGAYGQANQLPA